MNFHLYEYSRLRDFLYWLVDILDQGRATTTLYLYKNNYWRIGYLGQPVQPQCLVHKCSETIEGDIIEFDAKVGKFRAISAINLEPQKYYFVVLRTKSLTVVDDLIAKLENDKIKRKNGV